MRFCLPYAVVENIAIVFAETGRTTADVTWEEISAGRLKASNDYERGWRKQQRSGKSQTKSSADGAHAVVKLRFLSWPIQPVYDPLPGRVIEALDALGLDWARIFIRSDLKSDSILPHIKVTARPSCLYRPQYQ